jgi:hypothetical protein
MGRVRFILLALLCLFGCSDTALTRVPDEPSPEIEVTPLEYDFGDLPVGESLLKTFLISNIGNDILNISNIHMAYANDAFILDSDISSISPDESAEIFVVYTPVTYRNDSNIINILSNDLDEPVVSISIAGSGSSPIIDIDPWTYQFDNTMVSCEDSEEFAITNIGNMDLIIDNIIYISNIPSDFYPESFYNINGDFPWTLAPGESIPVVISYIPEDTSPDNGALEVYSNDPYTPVAIAEQTGHSFYGDFITDVFTQVESVDVDILFVIDNSGSMTQNQINFKNNFNSFINAFYAAGISYNIGFITTDNKNLVSNSIISNSSPDPVTEVNDIIELISTYGMGTEKGLLYSYLATQPGEWAQPGGAFLRPDAKLVVIYLSDERDQSGGDVTIPQLISHLIALKGSMSMVTAHAVAGDFPSGCSGNGGAEFGDGYYDVVSGLSGSFLSICASDWGPQMDALARSSILDASFTLSEVPVVASIEAIVDGVVDYNWIFEESTNSIIFASPPAEGSLVEISYSVFTECY